MVGILASAGFSSAAHAQLLYAWGNNSYGVLGDGTSVMRLSPTLVQSGTGMGGAVAGAEPGYVLSIIRMTDGTTQAWGVTDGSFLSPSGTNFVMLPTPVGSLSNVVETAAGSLHAIVRTSDGSVWGWGENGNRQLGDGSAVDRGAPVQTVGLGGVTAIAAADRYSLALLSNGTVVGWGDGEYGQFGNGATPVSSPLVAATGLSGVTAIAAGGTHVLALRDNGTVWASGRNFFGQLGDNTFNSRSTFAVVPNLFFVRKIAAGGNHSLAVLQDGTVRAWGSQQSGQLGNPNYFFASQVPVAVPGLSNIADVKALQSSSFALSNDGRLWAWGANNLGQLGLGDTSPRATPTEVPSPLPGYRFRSIAACASGEHAFAIVEPCAPTLVSSPASVSTCPTTTSEFAVNVAGAAPLVYRWQYWDAASGGGAWVDLAVPVFPQWVTLGGHEYRVNGSANRVYVRPRAHFGLTLRCVVSGSGACGTVTSDAAELTVCAADFDCAAGVGIGDLFGFLDAWFIEFGLSSPPEPDAPFHADFDGDASVTVADLFGFLDAWFAEFGVCGV